MSDFNTWNEIKHYMATQTYGVTDEPKIEYALKFPCPSDSNIYILARLVRTYNLSWNLALYSRDVMVFGFKSGDSRETVLYGNIDKQFVKRLEAFCPDPTSVITIKEW